MAYEEYHVHTDRGSFLVTISDYVGSAGFMGAAITFAVVSIAVYLIAGVPILIWPILRETMFSHSETNAPFWTLVGLQLAFASYRAFHLAQTKERSTNRELVIQMLFFWIAFEAVQVGFMYLSYQALDAATLVQAQAEGYTFPTLMRMHFSTSYTGLGSFLGVAYISYAAAALPALGSCLAAHILGD